MNKAQSEIMGLMVVVMLILALFVIFVRFSLLKPASLTDELRTNVETTNLLRAMMKTTINSETVQNMVIQCYNTAGTFTDLEQELQAIFQATLKTFCKPKIIKNQANSKIF